MAKMAKVDYDICSDALFVYTGKKANDSIELGNYVIDFDADEKVTGIEIFDISRMLMVSKSKFESIKDAFIRVSQAKSAIYVMVLLKLVEGNQIVDKELHFSIPKLQKMSVLN